MAEVRVHYHQQLEAIESDVTQLFALVAEGLVGATDALLSGDREVVAVLTRREQAIDGLYQDAERLVNQQLAFQAPAPDELRFLLAVLRMVPELERSHDLVVHVARRADPSLAGELSPRARGLVQRMGGIGADMWRQVADAWHDRDARVAGELARRDDEMDGLHAALTAELGSGKMALPVVMDMTLVARFYERLGDHAVNIARRVAYLADPGEAERAAPPAGSAIG